MTGSRVPPRGFNAFVYKLEPCMSESEQCVAYFIDVADVDHVDIDLRPTVSTRSMDIAASRGH